MADSDGEPSRAGANFRLLIGGRAVYAQMLAHIAATRVSVALETYIFQPDAVGDRFRRALLGAAQRGVKVRLLLDAFGSSSVPANYFGELQSAGAQVIWFNPKQYLRLNFRNHRKLLVCDEAVAIVGGLNIASEYDGDGISQGWRDFAVEVSGPLAADLAMSFERMCALAPFRTADVRAFARRRPSHGPEIAAGNEPSLLVSGPGWRSATLRRTLHVDLEKARDVNAYACYFVPSRRIRRLLRGVARRGIVNVIVGAKTDVPMARWGSERWFSWWLRAGVNLYEYTPQILHAKLIVIDDIVYVGSANLDTRSLQINYELLLRLPVRELAAQVRELLQSDQRRSRQLALGSWLAERHWWQRLRSWWAYWILTRLDPFVARRRWKALS
jgi:cardiolipin synthase A/B